MCGICGIINFNGKAVSKELLEGMTRKLIHRGPDEEGYYLSPPGGGAPSAGLGMRRLSIIDLSTGHQPLFNEDRSIAVICNGEIYNFRELRAELEGRHSFSSRSDAEVIAHLYEDLGEGMLQKLRGMFALAVWDERRKTLFLARDRVGKKPLYYTRIGGNFSFASEMKSFLDLPGFAREVNEQAVHSYLTYQYVHGPETIWKGVTSLGPAQSLTLTADGKERVRSYWALRLDRKTSLSFDEAKAELRAQLKEATRLRMISDVPLGAFLSGGHDSSIIVGLMSQLSSTPVKTYSIGFEEKEYSELPFARLAARHFGTDHHELVVKPDYVSILPKIVWHYDQPYADSSALPSYFVSQITRESVKVALNGDGGDENFAGYLRYKALKMSALASSLLAFVPRSAFRALSRSLPVDLPGRLRYLRRFTEPLGLPPERRNLIWHSYFTNEQKDFVYSVDFKKRLAGVDSRAYLEEKFLTAPANDLIDRALYADLTAYLPEDLLVKMDIASMANSLEARSPFLDHVFMEFAASLPSSWKLHGLEGKYLLKEAFRDMLPPEIYRRHKQGFGIPLKEWFRGGLKDLLRSTVLSEKALARGYFDRANLTRFIDEHLQGRADHGYCLWALLMLELWHRVFIDREVQFT